MGRLSTRLRPVSPRTLLLLSVPAAVECLQRAAKSCHTHHEATPSYCRLCQLCFAPVQEPVGDLVLLGVGNDGHQLLQLLSRQLTSPVSSTRSSTSNTRCWIMRWTVYCG